MLIMMIFVIKLKRADFWLSNDINFI